MESLIMFSKSSILSGVWPLSAVWVGKNGDGHWLAGRLDPKAELDVQEETRVTDCSHSQPRYNLIENASSVYSTEWGSFLIGFRVQVLSSFRRVLLS